METTLNKFDYFLRKLKKNEGDEYLEEIRHVLVEIRTRIKQLSIIESRIDHGLVRYKKVDFITEINVIGQLRLDYEVFVWVASRLLKLISKIRGYRKVASDSKYREIMILRNQFIEHPEYSDGVKEQSFSVKPPDLFYKPMNFMGSNRRHYDKGFLWNKKDLKDLLFQIFTMN